MATPARRPRSPRSSTPSGPRTSKRPASSGSHSTRQGEPLRPEDLGRGSRVGRTKAQGEEGLRLRVPHRDRHRQGRAERHRSLVVTTAKALPAPSIVPAPRSLRQPSRGPASPSPSATWWPTRPTSANARTGSSRSRALGAASVPPPPQEPVRGQPGRRPPLHRRPSRLPLRRLRGRAPGVPAVSLYGPRDLNTRYGGKPGPVRALAPTGTGTLTAAASSSSLTTAKAPHGHAGGGCEHCVDAYGNAVIDPDTGRPAPLLHQDDQEVQRLRARPLPRGRPRDPEPGSRSGTRATGSKAATGCSRTWPWSTGAATTTTSSAWPVSPSSRPSR